MGFIKVPLITELPFCIFQKIGRLVLWEDLGTFELQFAETQASFADIPDDAEIRFNDSDIVTGSKGYNAWWSEEYKRREADDL